MATERKIRSGTTKHNWKRNQGREHESEGDREHESEREHEGEKEGEAKRAQTERAPDGRKNPQPVPASLYPRTLVVRGYRGPTTGRSEQKTKEET